MVLGFRLRACFPGVICPTIGLIHPKLPSRIHCDSWSRFNKCGSTQMTPGKIRDGRTHCFLSRNYAISVGGNYHLAKSDEDFDQEPLWSFMLKEAFGFLRSLLIFLVEQPSQLKYIEWPSFQSTVILEGITVSLLLYLKKIIHGWFTFLPFLFGSRVKPKSGLVLIYSMAGVL